MNPIETNTNNSSRTVPSSGGSSAIGPALQAIQSTPQPAEVAPSYLMQLGTWAAKKYCERYVYSPGQQEAYKVELQEWLCADGSSTADQKQALESVIASLAKTLKPLIPPPFDSVEASQGFILAVLHSLAKNSLDDQGKTTLSLMVEKLTVTLQPHLSQIRTKINENQDNLEAKAPEILTPVLHDVFKLLIAPSALFPFLPVSWQDSFTERVINGLLANVATFENLQRLKAVDKLFQDTTSDDALKDVAPAIQTKIEQAKEPGAAFLREILSKDDALGKLIIDFLGDKDTHSSEWLQGQLAGLIAGNSKVDLVGDASVGITKIVTKLILRLSEDAEDGKTSEVIQEKTMGVLKSAVQWFSDNKGKVWDVKGSTTKAEDFRGLADLAWEQLQLDDFGTLFELPESDQKAITNKLKAELPSLLESLYEATADGYVHELFNEVHSDDNGPVAIDPEISQFAEDCAKYTANMIINEYLTKPENSEEFAKLIKATIADHKDFQHFLPLTDEFWTNITSEVIAENPAIKEGLTQYLEHTMKQMITRLISQLDKASPDVGSTFDQEAKAAVLEILKKHLKGDKTIRTRKESIEGISAMLRELFALGEDEIPIPKDFQELFWEKGLPQLIENMADNFLNAPYMKSKLANFIHDLDKEELGKDEISLPKIENQELHNLSTDLVREAVTFGEVRLIRIFQFLGWSIGMDGTFAHKSAIKLLYGMFGKQVVDNINNWDIKKIIYVSIEAANKNQVFTKKDEPPTRNLADEIIHYIDILGNILLLPKFRRKGEDLEKWLKSKSADDAIKLKRFVEAFCRLLISPWILLYNVVKIIIEIAIKNRINFSLNKAEKEIDLSLVHDALEAVLQKWKEHSNAEAAS